MAKSIEKNEILCDIIQKSIDIFQLYGLMAGKLIIDLNVIKKSGEIFLTYTQKEENETITVSKRIT